MVTGFKECDVNLGALTDAGICPKLDNYLLMHGLALDDELVGKWIRVLFRDPACTLTATPSPKLARCLMGLSGDPANWFTGLITNQTCDESYSGVDKWDVTFEDGEKRSFALQDETRAGVYSCNWEFVDNQRIE